jgi:putative membrane protein
MWGTMGGYYDSGNWIWMTLMMVLIVAGVIAFGIWAFRSNTRRPATSTDPAIDVLRRRLASGEITQDDYDKTRKVLGG